MKKKHIGMGLMVLLAVGIIGCSGAETNRQTETIQTEEQIEQAGSNLTKNKETLADGTYTIEVTLEGGSGRASIESPTQMVIQNGEAIATIRWSSSSYDYMVVDEQKYEPISMEECSVFEIPVLKLDEAFPVIADTIAMSVPHEIEYTVIFDSASVQNVEETTGKTWAQIKKTGSMELTYAQQFVIDYYEDGYEVIQMQDGTSYLLIPEQAAIPAQLPADITVIQKPLQNIYMVSSSSMDFFRALEGISQISFCGIQEDGWYVEEARLAMQKGDIRFAGKYHTPDYEALLAGGCDLALENTMIYHNPEVKEQLESLQIPVVVERSSYESHPLGRLEWVKFYGALLGKEEQAETFFAEQTKELQMMMEQENTGKTVAFFYVTSNGAVNVRKTNDYIPNMISLAGANYIFTQLEEENENALSTVKIQMEAFYATAKDADILIYNSTIDEELTTIQQLIEKSALFADFKAVQTGEVYCLKKNVFQETTALGKLMQEFHEIFTTPETTTSLQYIQKLEKRGVETS